MVRPAARVWWEEEWGLIRGSRGRPRVSAEWSDTATPAVYLVGFDPFELDPQELLSCKGVQIFLWKL
jgi:hypothetical protein